MTQLMDVLRESSGKRIHRKTFRKAILHYLRSLGYHACGEDGAYGSCCILAGDPDQARILVAAVYDGPGQNPMQDLVALLEIARSLPAGSRNRVCFLLFEKRAVRAFLYRHGESLSRQLLLELHQSGTGDEILLMPCKELDYEVKTLEILGSCCGRFGKKQIRLVRNQKLTALSRKFPRACCIGSLRKNRAGGHTPDETDETNVNLLRAALISLITCHAVK